jgi:hypothetical protein
LFVSLFFCGKPDICIVVFGFPFFLSRLSLALRVGFSLQCSLSLPNRPPSYGAVLRRGTDSGPATPLSANGRRGRRRSSRLPSASARAGRTGVGLRSGPTSRRARDRTSCPCTGRLYSSLRFTSVKPLTVLRRT